MFMQCSENTMNTWSFSILVKNQKLHLHLEFSPHVTFSTISAVEIGGIKYIGIYI